MNALPHAYSALGLVPARGIRVRRVVDLDETISGRSVDLPVVRGGTLAWPQPDQPVALLRLSCQSW